jgi:threonine/homoserine efflux transporter RhtA
MLLLLLLLLLPAGSQRQHRGPVGVKCSVHPAAAYLQFYITSFASCRNSSSGPHTAAAAMGVHVLRAVASAAAAIKQAACNN